MFQTDKGNTLIEIFPNNVGLEVILFIFNLNHMQVVLLLQLLQTYTSMSIQS